MRGAHRPAALVTNIGDHLSGTRRLHGSQAILMLWAQRLRPAAIKWLVGANGRLGTRRGAGMMLIGVHQGYA